MRRFTAATAVWRFGCFAAATALAGCADGGMNRNPAADKAAPASVIYQCSDLRFVARFDEDQALLSLPEGTAQLARTVAASGAKYSNGNLTLWRKEDTAILTGKARTTAHCRLHDVAGAWEDARLRGIDFRALGHKPDWVLEIDRGESVYLTLEGASAPIILPAPTAIFDPESEQTLYRARNKSHSLLVILYGDTCERPLDGERFLNTVTVRLDGRELRGCGRTIY
ncbi:MAG: MliC family protein [Alphaproteobacteria bacterium]